MAMQGSNDRFSATWFDQRHADIKKCLLSEIKPCCALIDSDQDTYILGFYEKLNQSCTKCSEYPFIAKFNKTDQLDVTFGAANKNEEIAKKNGILILPLKMKGALEFLAAHHKKSKNSQSELLLRFYFRLLQENKENSDIIKTHLKLEVSADGSKTSFYLSE